MDKTSAAYNAQPSLIGRMLKDVKPPTNITDKHMCCIAERPTQTTWRGVQVEQSAHLFITTRVVVFEQGILVFLGFF